MSADKTCPGNCCQSFPISTSYEELLDRQTTGSARCVEDSEQIIDMLEIDPRKPGHYNCRHYDSRSGRCLTYERRPAMCSRYPYDSDCPFCTYDPKKPDVPGVLREVPLP